jgi:hypothetical protein
MIRIYLVTFGCALALALAACGGQRANVQCETNSNCDLSGGGMCVAAAADSQDHWCAYPDPQCPSGYRFSDDDVGDGVAGQCVPGDVSNSAKLSVTVDGSGTVTSDPPGLACSSGSCSASFPKGTQVRLTATTTSMTFLGWSGACRGILQCTVTLDQDTDTRAWFGAAATPLWAVHQ